jgi:hypothetical protein
LQYGQEQQVNVVAVHHTDRMHNEWFVHLSDARAAKTTRLRRTGALRENRLLVSASIIATNFVLDFTNNGGFHVIGPLTAPDLIQYNSQQPPFGWAGERLPVY